MPSRGRFVDSLKWLPAVNSNRTVKRDGEIGSGSMSRVKRDFRVHDRGLATVVLRGECSSNSQFTSQRRISNGDPSERDAAVAARTGYKFVFFNELKLVLDEQACVVRNAAGFPLFD